MALLVLERKELLIDSFKVVNVLTHYVLGDCIPVTSFGIIEDLIPVSFGVPFDRLGSELIRACETSLFFHAVCNSFLCSPGDLLKVDLLVDPFESRRPYGVGEVHEELDVWCTILALLKLPTGVGSLEFVVDTLEVDLG